MIMRTKLFYIGTGIVVLVLCISLNALYMNTQKTRVHQHLTVSNTITDTTNQNGVFSTHLPIIKINTHGQKVPGSPIGRNDSGVVYELAEDGTNNITVEMGIIDHQNTSNKSTDAFTLSSNAQIHYRGNSSRYFDKKSYAITLVNEKGEDNPQELLGMSSHHKWVLNGPFLDRSLIRNYMGMNIAGEIMSYAPNVRYCELFVDGNYRGVYLLMETISVGEGRLNLTKSEKNKPYTSFIVNWDRATKNDIRLNNFTYYTLKSGVSALDVNYPGTSNLTPSKLDYIAKEISLVEKMLYSSDIFYEDTYTNYLDIDEFANYFIINEFFRNADAGYYSTFLYRDLREKIRPVVWDFNNSCNNFMTDEFDESGFSLTDAPWFNQLIKDKKFVSLVIGKYKELRETVLSQQYLTDYIDSVDQWLGKSIERNDEVWGYVYDLTNYDDYNYLSPAKRNVTSHEEAVAQLKDYIVKRGKWLDRNIDILYQYCAESKNAGNLIR